MRFLRTTILAIGLMSFAVACGGSSKGAEEPAAPAEPAAEEGMEGEMPEAAPAEGAEEGMDDPCAAGGEEDPCAGGEM